MIATTYRPTPRRAFTLVELLVATALIVFIMVILTEAFSAGIGTFRLLKAQGDMKSKLANAGSLLMDDLRQAAFRLQRQEAQQPVHQPGERAAGGVFLH